MSTWVNMAGDLALADKQDAELAKLELIRLLLADTVNTSDASTLAKLEQIRVILANPTTGLNQEVTQVLIWNRLADIQAAVEAIAIDADQQTAALALLATEATQLAQSSSFARLLKFEPAVGGEIRRDETLTDDYHGAAVDGTATTAASWDVVRFYKTAGLIVRVRFRTGVAWDSRTAGW